ncbi:glycosyl hydrolase family 28-related protein [Paenibacillus sp. HB172176]|uniref:fibronectin type III domain-containing protein n=1 Tax=Paenibacillus sp. HB172176 TaxID=2493690 RepID=UPI00143BB223|nr:glycosyl hydrolase family 28-related protein [Paenibacillus sp. HB172176]
MKKRHLSLWVLIMTLIAGMIPAYSAAAQSSALYIGEESETQGDWVGRFGAEGYVLPFFTTTLTSGRDNPLADDVASLPSYIDSYTSHGSSYWVSGPVDERALQTPDGTSRKRVPVYSGTSLYYTFTLNDENSHLFSIYTTDFGSVETVVERFEIQTANGGSTLASVDVDTINNGKYITFLVKGSFRFKATKLASGNVSTLGFFFDAPVPTTAQNLSAAPEPGRKVQLSWTDAAATKTVILRKEQSEAAYQPIAMTDAGENSYLDENLVSGGVYSYQLQNKVGALLAAPTAAATVQLPSYSATSLSFTDSEPTLEEPGQTVAMSVYYSDEAGTGIGNAPVTFTLSGEYVGEYIDANLGTVSTDTNGFADLTYTPSFAGDYTVTASTPADDAELLSEASATASLLVKDKAWLSPPLLLRASDAVKPGMLFQVSGHAMIASDVEEVKAVVEPLATAGSAPGGSAVELEIVQRDQDRGQFLQLLFPDSLSAGAYRLWVSNAHGWSAPITLNAPRPLFISEYEVYNGLSIALSGRNLMAGEFDAAGESKVRLKNVGGVSYPVEITELTPYSLRFLVENVPLGDYNVEVSNDGGFGWQGLQSAQTLTVVPQGEDPLGLGVAWASDFQWEDQFEVTDYGAVAGDGMDDTAAIAAAVSAAKQAGGGVVHLPAGEFQASVVQLPSGIVLMGEGPENTLLYHTGGSANFIQATGDGKTEGHTGIARIGLRAADDEMYPDAFIWLGQDWGSAVSDSSLRTASEIFVTQVSLDYPVLDPAATGSGSGRGQGMIAIGDERFLFKDNRMAGWDAQYTRVYMNEYAESTGNYIEYATDQMPITAAYTFITDNEFVIRGEADVQVHGIGIKDHSHVENNIVRTTGADQKVTFNNDGESIFAEMPGAYFATGNVLGATANSIVLAPAAPVANPSPGLRSGKLSIMIIDGTGMGQYREVTHVSDTEYTLIESWDVVPDSTSKFSLIAPNDNVTIYRNEIIDGQRGIWLYGNVVDAVVADNRLSQTDGIYVYSSGVVGTNRYTPTYFVNVKGNQLIGTPGEANASGIIAVSQRSGVEGKYYATGVYGIEIRDNYLYGSKTPVSTVRHQKISGLVSSAATLSSDGNPTFTSEDRDNLNVIFENNRLEHMLDGMTLTDGLYAHSVKGNTYDDVDEEIYEKNGSGTSDALVLTDAYRDERPPFWPAFSELSAELTDEETAELSWNPADDSTGVAGYRVTINGEEAAVLAAETLSYTAEELLPGTAYTFEVTALDAAGGESYTKLEATLETDPVPGQAGYERGGRWHGRGSGGGYGHEGEQGDGNGNGPGSGRGHGGGNGNGHDGGSSQSGHGPGLN